MPIFREEMRIFMQEYLIVVDMQNDFIDGALGTKEAQGIVENVVERVKNFSGKVLFTRDTHGENYLETQEGKHLPVEHCMEHTSGWQICKELQAYCKEPVMNKVTFGSVELGEYLRKENEKEKIQSITLVGLCTDICVISNAMLCKAFLPEVEIIVDAKCCAGVTPESHTIALEAMKTCQICIENE